MGNDVWFAYQAPCTGTAVAEFCGAGSANYDTVIAAWNGTCGSLSQLVCNDDFCGLQSHITFGVTAGTIYYISVGGFVGSTGSFTLSMGCLLPLANDSCVTAAPISEGVVTAGANIGAGTGPDPVTFSCGYANASDVWYSLVAACSGNYQATTCDAGTTFDTVLTIWDGSSGCGTLVELACNDDNCNLPSGNHFLNSTVTWTAVAGQQYFISVAGFYGSTGTFNLLVNAGGALALNFINAGSGTIGYTVTGAPPGGLQFTAISLFPGNYPTGWFYGIDIGFSDLVNQINFGFPFLTGLTSCGSVTVGPFGGLPTGLTLYGVTLGVPFGSPAPSIVSAPTSATIP
jgi:hypothetical protein